MVTSRRWRSFIVDTEVSIVLDFGKSLSEESMDGASHDMWLRGYVAGQREVRQKVGNHQTPRTNEADLLQALSQSGFTLNEEQFERLLCRWVELGWLSRIPPRTTKSGQRLLEPYPLVFLIEALF